MPADRNIHLRGLFCAAVLILLVSSACGVDRLPLPLVSPRQEPVTVDASADLRVLPPAAIRLASVTALPSELHVVEGGIAIFTASARDETGRVLSRVTYDWSVVESEAGTVTSNGVFTASGPPGVYEDAVMVEARQQAGDEVNTAEQTITVIIHTGEIDQTLGRAVVSPSTVQGRPGERVPLQAIAIGAGGGLVHGVELSWRVLDGRAGSVDPRGLFTLGFEPGRYPDAIELEAKRAGSDDPPVRALASVQVFSPDEVLRDVRALISPTMAVGGPGDTVPLSIFAFDVRGRPVTIQGVEWSVADPPAGHIGADGRLTLGNTPGDYPEAVEARVTLGGDFAGQELGLTAGVVTRDEPARPDDAVAPTTPQIVPGTVRVKQGVRERMTFLYPDTAAPGSRGDRVEWSATTDAVSVDSRGRVTAEGPPGVYRGAVRAEVRREDGTVHAAEATVVVLGPLHRVDVVPATLTTEPGMITHFTALAYDAAGNRLTDVRFTWELAPGTPGTITGTGLYAAGDESGTFPGAIRVRAVQR